MGFISYCLKYYSDELEKLEKLEATEATIYKAKQLLKILDDLVGEGYFELSDELEKTYQGVTRLKTYLNNNFAKPFMMPNSLTKELDISYKNNELELKSAINDIYEEAKIFQPINDEFLKNLKNFCEWIGYEEDTAYIFLFRDTLLPYIYYKAKNYDRIHPWLLSRQSLTYLAGKSDVDDEVRSLIMDGLESGKGCNWEEFKSVVLPAIKAVMLKYPTVEATISQMLKQITEKHIIVIESGCSGTFPLLLMSFDERVDIRMYTTYPYLFDLYSDKIFTYKYEENRLFETKWSQDLLFQFSSLKDFKFYVKKCINKEVIEKSLSEIKTMIN